MYIGNYYSDFRFLFFFLRRLTDVLKRKRTAKRPATSTNSRKRQDDLRSSLVVQEIERRGKLNLTINMYL